MENMRRRAFTLVELLVVIGVIVLLVAVLLPVLSKVREQGLAVLCQNNQRTLWHADLVFAADNEGHLVGNQYDTANSVFAHRDWLRGSDNTSTGWQNAPQAGTLWGYVRDARTYLCPTRDHASGIGTLNDLDASSNGQFDYAIFLSFAGAKLEHLPSVATATDPTTGTLETILAPMVVEEQPESINKTNVEGGHANTDHLAHNHRGGAFYIATDGSAQFYIEPAAVMAKNYFAAAPSRKQATIGFASASWGWWDRQ
jgi:prepilin-type N-terminal cleavage/methylation domain-containing protein